MHRNKDWKNEKLGFSCFFRLFAIFVVQVSKYKIDQKLFFFLFRAAPVAYRGSQARG